MLHYFYRVQSLVGRRNYVDVLVDAPFGGSLQFLKKIHPMYCSKYLCGCLLVVVSLALTNSTIALR